MFRPNLFIILRFFLLVADSVNMAKFSEIEADLVKFDEYAKMFHVTCGSFPFALQMFRSLSNLHLGY